jgi:hypothetical protein
MTMPDYQYSQEFLQYTKEYQHYLAVRDMCTIMVALHRQDYEMAANTWNRHEGPHARLTITAISWFIDYLMSKGQDPAAWARDYDAHAGSEDISVRDMCRMMIALHHDDSDAAVDVWNEHEGPHFKLATEAITGLRIYLVRNGQDPIEWASSFEAYGATQAGCQPSLGGEKRPIGENHLIRNTQQESLTDSAIAATTADLGIATTRDDWTFCDGDDTSNDHPYVEYHITPGRLWLRVTGGPDDENQQPTASSGIWCPEVLGGDSSVPMKRFALDGLQLVMGGQADSKPSFRARMRGIWGWAAVVLVFLVGLIAGGLARALLLGGAAALIVGIVAGIRSLRGTDDGSHRRTALTAVSAGLIAAFTGVMIVAASAPATTSLPPSTSAPTPSPRSTTDGGALAKADASTNAEAEAEDKSRASAGAESKGSSASFEHFKVSVTQVSRNSSQLRLQAKVCVKSLPPDPQGNRTRISWDPWSIRAGSRTIEPDVNAAPLEKEFPADATYRVGECASGWIPFATNRTVTRIVYANGVGDRAVWDAANLAAQPTTRRS